MQVGVGRVERRFGGDCIRFRGLHRGLIGAHVRRGLHIFQLRQQLSLLYVIAFLNVQVGNLSVGVGADVDVSLRLNFTRSAHHRRQVLALDFSSLHRDHVLAALMHRDPDDDGQQHHRAGADRDFFPGFHCLRRCPGLASLAFGLMFDPSQVHRLDGHVF